MNRLESIREMLAQEPGDPFLQYALALELQKENLPGDAEEALLKLKKEHPDYLPLYYQLGQFLESQQRFDEALQVYREGEKLAEVQRDLKTRSELQEAIWELEDE